MNSKLSRIAPTPKSGTVCLRRIGCDSVRSGSDRNSGDAVRVSNLNKISGELRGLARSVAIQLAALSRIAAELAQERGQLDLPNTGGDLAAEIVDVVCAQFRVSRMDLTTPRRTEREVWPRFAAVYLWRDLTDLSLDELREVSRQFFFRHDRNWVGYALTAVRNRMAAEPAFRDKIESLRAQLIPRKKDETGNRDDPGLKTISAHRYDERRLAHLL